MKIPDRRGTVLVALAFALLSPQADAADRMSAGLWVGTWTGAGRTRQTSECLSQADADALNGDARSIRAYLEKTIPPTACKVSDIIADGGRVTYTAACGSAKARVITTTYHGDRFESADSDGGKSEAKRVGAC